MSKAAPDDAVPYATTLHVRDTCLCLFVQRAARALARRFDLALKPLELTNGQFSLLMSLNRPPAAAPSIGAVAQLLAMDRTTLTAALKPLERRGLIAIHPDPADKRSRLLALTKAGRRLLAQALPIWQMHHRALEDSLPGAAPARLRRDLSMLSDSEDTR
ncbi:MarR family winged helix-turn-helix transcriptional regulator [Dongia sp.]|uniref:MarR family winged helix-turn-helix transcriptional regulator n=1 Tax=Dongia sp. TaxID=1977262 RepID=UPI0035AEF9C5